MRIIYLSGAPRLSTSPSSESMGPRSHILGVISAFRSLGAEVVPIIVGDSMPTSFTHSGSEKRLSGSIATVVAADFVRLFSRVRSRAKTRKELSNGTYNFAYERYALFQNMGLAARRANVPWVLEVNALLSIESTSDRRATASRRFAHFLEGRAFRAAHTIVAVTEELSLAIQREHGVEARRIVVVENGVDHTRFPARSVQIDSGPTINVGFVGALYKWQNLDMLLDAIALPEFADVHVHIAGDGAERVNLTEKINSLGLAGRVHMKGRLTPDDVPAFLSKMDIAFSGHGSANGAYFSPLKLWEYLASGTPVISSRHKASLELKQGEFAVLLFDTENMESLVEAIRSARSDLSRLVEIAAAKQDTVREKYSWQARVQPLLKRMEVR
jgi:glycosyltransferase involved in cell wall biosynthesis